MLDKSNFTDIAMEFGATHFIDSSKEDPVPAIQLLTGTFKAALNAVKLLAQTPISTSINSVLTARNAHEIPALHELAQSMGVSFRASRFRPSGRGRDNWEDLRPTARQLLDFSHWLDNRPDVRTGDSFFPLTRQERQGLGLNLCGAAKLTCCVGPTGDVFPCAFLQSARFYAGSIRQSSFLDIWDNAEIFHSFRNLRIHSCEDCKRFDQCHGGCLYTNYDSVSIGLVAHIYGHRGDRGT